MRLNAIHPEDNPIEKLLFCFGGDGDDGDSGGDDRPTTSPAQRGGLSSSAARDVSRDAERARDIGSIGTGGGRDDDRVDTSLQASRAPMATGYGIASPNFVQEAIRGFTGPQTQTIGQATSFPGGMNIAPYSPGAVTFADRTTARTYDPLGQQTALRMNLGVAPDVTQGDQSFADRIRSGIEGAFTDTTQRAAMFDPQTGQFTTPTMEKVDENRFQDFAANLINPFSGITGLIDTADYVPLTGGDTYQFSQMSGGLLDAAGLGQPTLVSYDELERRRSEEMMGRDGDDDDFTQFADINEDEGEEETRTVDLMMGEPYVPPQRQYQAFESNFYNIPQRFRSGLLG